MSEFVLDPAQCRVEQLPPRSGPFGLHPDLGQPTHAGGDGDDLSLTNDRGWSHGADFTDNYSTTLNLGDVGWSYSSNFNLALTDSSGKSRPTVTRGPDNVTTPPQPPPPAASAQTGQSGANATITVANFPVSGPRSVRCWNATDATHNWSTNYLGETVIQLPASGNGTVTFSCPVAPSPGVFSVEILLVMWASPTTWK